MYACVVFTPNRSFYPTTSSVHPESVLILNPREMEILWSKMTTVKQSTINQTVGIHQGKKASEVLACRVSYENTTKQARS